MGVRNKGYIGFANEPRAKGCQAISQKAPATIKYVNSMHPTGYFAYGEDSLTLCLTSKLVDLRVGYAKRIQELRSCATSQSTLHI